MNHFGAIPNVTPLRVTLRGSMKGPEARRTAMVSFATPQEASIAMSRGRYFHGDQLTMSYFRGTSTGGDRMETQKAPPPPVSESRELLFSYVPVELFSEDAVKHLFNSISGNAVVSVSIRSRPHRGSVKRTAIVTFGDVDAARTALQNLPLFNGDRLQVNYRSKPPHVTNEQKADVGQGGNGSWNDGGQGTRWKSPSPMQESHLMNDVADPFDVEEVEMGKDGNGDNHAVQQPERGVMRGGPASMEKGWESNGGNGTRGEAEENRLSAIEQLRKDIAEKERERQKRRSARASKSVPRGAVGQRQPSQPKESGDLARGRGSKTVVRKPENTGEGWRKSGKVNIKDAVQLVGTCETMCPAKEVEERILQRDISVFETVCGKGSDADPAKAVKKYRRSAAISEEPKPEDIRPPQILMKTMEHLRIICDTKEESFAEIHNFVRDRTRSLRQDFTYQGVRDDTCIKIHEESVRFHILSEHRLAGSDPAVFSSKQNREQLDKCLISLREMYDLRRELNLPTSPNEPEMQAYYMLLQMSGQQTCVQLLKGYSSDVRNSLPIQFALHVVKSCSNSYWDYVGFFKCLRAAPYLVACMMYMRSHYMRCQALKIINSSHNSKDIILVSKLTEIMCFDGDEEAIRFCSKAGFGIRDLDKSEKDAPVKAMLMASRLDTDKWDELLPQKPSAFVEKKSGTCRPSEIIAGALSYEYNLSSLPHDCSGRLLDFKREPSVGLHKRHLHHEAAPAVSSLVPSAAVLPPSKPVKSAQSAETELPASDGQFANRPNSSILHRLGYAPPKENQCSKAKFGVEKLQSRSAFGETANWDFMEASKSSPESSTGQTAGWNAPFSGNARNVSSPLIVKDLEQAPQQTGTVHSSEVGTRSGNDKRVSFQEPTKKSEKIQSSPAPSVFGSIAALATHGMPSAKPEQEGFPKPPDTSAVEEWKRAQADSRNFPLPPDNSAAEEWKRAQAEADREARRQAEEAKRAAREEAERLKQRKAANKIQNALRMHIGKKIAEAGAKCIQKEGEAASLGAFTKLVRELVKDVQSIRRRLKKIEDRFTSISTEIEKGNSSTCFDGLMFECRQAQSTMEVLASEIGAHLSKLNKYDPKSSSTKELQRMMVIEFDEVTKYGRVVWKMVWRVKGIVIVTPSNLPQRTPSQKGADGKSLKRKRSEAWLNASSRKEQERSQRDRLEVSENISKARKLGTKAATSLLQELISLMKGQRLIRAQIAVIRSTSIEFRAVKWTQDWIWKQFRCNASKEAFYVCTEEPGQIPCHLGVRKCLNTGIPITANMVIFSLELSSREHFELQCKWITDTLIEREQSKNSDKNFVPVMILQLCFDSRAEPSCQRPVRPQEAQSFGEGLVRRGLIAGSVPVHIPAYIARWGKSSEDIRVALKVAVQKAALESTRLSLVLHPTTVGDRAVQVGNSAWIRYLSMEDGSSHLGLIDSINLAWAGLVELLREEEGRWPEEMSAQVQRMREIRIGLRRKLRLPMPAEVNAKNSSQYITRLVALSNVCVPKPNRDWKTLPEFCRALGHLMVPLVSKLLGESYATFVYLPKPESADDSANLVGLSHRYCNLANDINPPVMIDRTWDGRVIGEEPLALRTVNEVWQNRQQFLLGRKRSDVGNHAAEGLRKLSSLGVLQSNLDSTPKAMRRRLSLPGRMSGERDERDLVVDLPKRKRKRLSLPRMASGSRSEFELLDELCEIEEAHQSALDGTIEMLRREHELAKAT